MQTSSEMKSGDFNLLFLGYLDGPLESKIRDYLMSFELENVRRGVCECEWLFFFVYRSFTSNFTPNICSDSCELSISLCT